MVGDISIFLGAVSLTMPPGWESFFMTFEIQREIIDFLKRWILFHFRFSLNILYIDVIDSSVSRVSRGCLIIFFYIYSYMLTEAVMRRCSVKKMFLKITFCWEVLLITFPVIMILVFWARGHCILIIRSIVSLRHYIEKNSYQYLPDDWSYSWYWPSSQS